MSSIRDMKSVFVTGGAGSLGSELVLHYLKKGQEVWALDHDDSRLAMLEVKIPAEHKARFHPVLVSIRDKEACIEAITSSKASLVIHTAALKQVPLLEKFSKMAYQTNVVGTQHVLDACKRLDARLVFVSTDKAVDAVSVMGQTKAKSEYEVLGYDRGLVVRLPNIMWTRGALRDLILAQQNNHGVVELTSAEMKRWWMKMSEGISFIYDVAENLDPGFVYAPMKTSEKKVSEVIKEIGEKEGVALEISETAPRPGERMQEALWSSDTEVAEKIKDFKCWKISRK